MNSKQIMSRIDQINRKYNADKDCSPDYPTVNWSDFMLAECISGLLDIIDDLTERIEDLESEKNDRDNISLYLPTGEAQ